MARLDPTTLDRETSKVLRERPWVATHSKSGRESSRRVPKASPAERQRVWDVLIEVALHGKRVAIFEKLNSREVDFVQRLGFECRDQGREDDTSYTQSHLGRLEDERQRCRDRVRMLEKDVFAPNEKELAREKDTYWRITGEIEKLKTKDTTPKPILFWSVNLDRRSQDREILVDYDARWIGWLITEGQDFLKSIEMTFEAAVHRGDRWEIFKVESHIDKLQRHLEYSEHRPWTPHKVFLEKDHLTFHGPHPLVFKYFMETLGYKCSIKWSPSFAMVRVGW
jgi:hypothetical protein